MKPETVISAYAEEIDARTNTRVLTNEPGRMVYQIDGQDGSGTVEVLTLFPGVILQFHSFHCKSFRLAVNGNVNEGLKINFCSEGRMEVRMSDNLCLFMEPGNLSLDVRTAQDSFQFPCGHYHGVELFLHHSSIGKVFPEAWEELKINPTKIQDRFCGEGKSYVIFADERFKQIFDNMLNAPDECRTEYLKIKATELLFLLGSVEMPDKSDTASLMTTGQVEIAKQVMEIVTRDLSQHTSVETLAGMFGISPSSIKNYFRGVYGKNISTYLRETRMSAAALALRDGKQPIGEIATAVGYENASKFSAAFKSFFGETPLEYRRQSRCGI
ncbi:MAG: AraC family transcriptional regulator [Eubacteriales bacterium]|nr:AraC family transcriptional regulator [Eubacteriales bacterium]